MDTANPTEIITTTATTAATNKTTTTTTSTTANTSATTEFQRNDNNIGHVVNDNKFAVDVDYDYVYNNDDDATD